MEILTVDAQRLWDSLMQMAQIGATPKGGCCRLALSDEDRRGRDLFIDWCKAAGLAVRMDEMGNVFARRAGRDANLPPVVMGSHLDTQPTGGKFDGPFGVLAALEVLRTLVDRQIATDHPLEVVSWTTEAGARFVPAMMASGVFVGALTRDYAYGQRDIHGTSFQQALEAIGYRGAEPCRPFPMRAYLEPHIEQGPILEAEGVTIGVVTGAQGQYWYDAKVVGRESHAGTTPMDRRRDALTAAAQLVSAVEAVALTQGPPAVATVGQLKVMPYSRNTVPGEVTLSVEFRHPQQEVLDAMEAALGERLAAIETRGVKVELQRFWHSPPLTFDPTCVAAVRNGAQRLGLSHRDIPSGAGHDACYISKVAPTAMIFIPCKDGISHNEAESASFDDVAAGANVLLQAALEIAKV
ncbi:MAG: Zn-dependent hydrolase [Candidatus Competibacterales bacterium]